MLLNAVFWWEWPQEAWTLNIRSISLSPHWTIYLCRIFLFFFVNNESDFSIRIFVLFVISLVWGVCDEENCSIVLDQWSGDFWLNFQWFNFLLKSLPSLLVLGWNVGEINFKYGKDRRGQEKCMGNRFSNTKKVVNFKCSNLLYRIEC